MMMIAEKLKAATPSLTDPEAGQLLKDLYTKVGNYVGWSSEMFMNPDMMDEFVDRFLNSQSYLESQDGIRVPTYDPFHIGYTEINTHPEFGNMRQWLAYYSNCFIVYTEYKDHPDKSVLLFFMDKQTYNACIEVQELNDFAE